MIRFVLCLIMLNIALTYAIPTKDGLIVDALVNVLRSAAKTLRAGNSAKTQLAQRLQPVVPPINDSYCADNNQKCSRWAVNGWCKRSRYMLNNCKKSCNLCQGGYIGEISVPRTDSCPEELIVILSGLAYQAQDDKVGKYHKAGTVNERPYWKKDEEDKYDHIIDAIWFDPSHSAWEIGPIDKLGSDIGGLYSIDKMTPCPTGLSWKYVTNRTGNVEWIDAGKLAKVMDSNSCPEKLTVSLSGLAYEAQVDHVGKYNMAGTVNGRPYWKKDEEDQALWFDAQTSDWEAGPISSIQMNQPQIFLYSNEKSTPCPTGLTWNYVTNRTGAVQWIDAGKLAKVEGCKQCSEFMWFNEGGTIYGNEAIEKCDWGAEMTKMEHKWHALEPSYCLVIHLDAAVQKRDYDARTLAVDEKICGIGGWRVFGIKDCQHFFKKFGDGGWSNWSYMLAGNQCEKVDCSGQKGCYAMIKGKEDCL